MNWMKEFLREAEKLRSDRSDKNIEMDLIGHKCQNVLADMATLPSDRSARSPNTSAEHSEFEASLNHLASVGISIAILADGSMRVVQTPAEASQAAADGYVVYTPKDMYYFIQLDRHEREVLHGFKSCYPGIVEWRER